MTRIGEPMSKSLDDQLDAIRVMEVSETPIASAKDMRGWHAVTDEDGIIAYFAHETDAFFFRLALINARMNPIANIRRR
jgi:hypothetical protein